MAATELTRTHRILIGVVVAGAVVIAAIGFAGSYTAVRDLAQQKGFGTFSYFFPIGIDAGICVLLALDLLLTWIRIPFPLLRQTAWLLTAATIAFNGAAAWPDPLGVGMHSVIPVLFVVAVEAARHAVGRIADITADKHMEGVRITRWILSPLPTFLLWRRMKLWELRSYEQVIKLEQERLVYQARLRSRYGRSWRRKAPVEAMMPLRLARYGVPLADTAPAGLAAAGIEPALLPPAPRPTAPSASSTPELEPARGTDPAHDTDRHAADGSGRGPAAEHPHDTPQPGAVHPEPHPTQPQQQHQHHRPEPQPQPQPQPQPENSPWFAAQQQPVAYEGTYAGAYEPGYGPGYERGYERGYEAGHAPGYAPEQDWQDPAGGVPDDRPRIPSGSPGRTRPLSDAHFGGGAPTIPAPRAEQQAQQAQQAQQHMPEVPQEQQEPEEQQAAEVPGLPEDATSDERYYAGFRKYVAHHNDYPNARQFGLYLQDLYGVTGQTGGPLAESTLRPYLRGFQVRHQQEMDEPQDANYYA